MDQPIKGFVIIALRTLGFRLGKGPDLLLFLPQNDNVLSLVSELADHLVSPVARITAFRAGHEDLLFHF